MDGVEVGAGPATGHRGVAVLRQIGAGASLPHRQLHAGGIARRRSLQEGGPRRQSELPVADQGRRGSSRVTGK
nr:unnamed protein product [Callosobruchus chinensis]